MKLNFRNTNFIISTLQAYWNTRVFLR